MSQAAATATASVAHRDRFPPQVKYIVGNEGCERFSFYGMSSILTVFMTGQLLFPERKAEAIFHLFVAGCYLTPLLGGWLSDRLIGRYRTILYLSFGYVAGHAVIALYETVGGLYAGMVLIALGAGGIKPCVSAFVGDQFPRESAHLLERVYGIFYWMINVGAVVSQLLIPKLLVWYGPRVAFGVPGVLMALALVIYVMGRKHYVKPPPTGPNPHSFMKVVLHALRNRRPGSAHWLDPARDAFPAVAVDGAKATFSIIGVFSMVLVFWSLFFQYGSTWVLQAQKMNLTFMGLKVEAAQLASANGAFILTMVPLFSYVIYPALEKRGFQVTPLRRMTVGMFIACTSFLAAAAVQSQVEAGANPSVMWQVVQYFLISVAEVLISVTGLEFAYTQAPASMKSTIMSFWFVAMALGSLLTAWVAKLNPFEGTVFYLFFAGLMFVAAIIFAIIASRYRPVAFAPASAS